MTSNKPGAWTNWTTFNNSGSNPNMNQIQLDAKIDSAIQDLLRQPQSKEYIKSKIMGKAAPALHLNAGSTSNVPTSGGINLQIKQALAQLIAEQNQKPQGGNVIVQKPAVATSQVIRTVENPSTEVYYDVAPSVYYSTVPSSTRTSVVAPKTPGRVYYNPQTPGRSRVVSYAPSTTVGRNYGYDGYYPNSYANNSYYTPYYSYGNRGTYGGYYDDHDYDYGYGDYYGGRYASKYGSKYGDYSTRPRSRRRYNDDYDYGYSGYDYDHGKDYYKRRNSLRRSRYV